MLDAITAARDGKPMSCDLVDRFITGIVKGTVPDYQTAAWLMAVYLNGLDDDTLVHVTEAMADIGSEPVVHKGQIDKHSTGGVGDKTTLILAPIMAALDIPMIKMSGRGLGHTGGTLDKLESIPGFSIDLDPERLERQMASVGVAVLAQSPHLAPADGVLYALRDVTATVDSVPLIAASIMSKKFAAGSPNLVLDVKVGSGAMMKTPESARELATLMIRLGQRRGMKVTAVLTSMDQPLGQAVGNAVEVMEAKSLLEGHGPLDLKDEVVTLASHMVALVKSCDLAEAKGLVTTVLESHKALERFRAWIEAQGGSWDALQAGLPLAPAYPVVMGQAGTVVGIDTQKVGEAARTLGAGRLTKGDSIDYGVGLRWLAPLGSHVAPDSPIAEVYARSELAAKNAGDLLQRAITLGLNAPSHQSVIDVISHA